MHKPEHNWQFYGQHQEAQPTPLDCPELHHHTDQSKSLKPL